jgi:hypothetical protein
MLVGCHEMENPSTDVVESKPCFQCGKLNHADESYCGGCGAPLALNDFIAARVAVEVSTAVRDRNVLETESSIRVFERAMGWVQKVGAFSLVVLGLVGGGVLWKVSDWSKAVDQAKASVSQDAEAARSQIKGSSSSASSEITNASQRAVEESKTASAKLSKVASDLATTAARTKEQMTAQASALKSEVVASQTSLDAANKLQPDMQRMQIQLTDATKAIGEQQKVLSSKEDLAKQIFSSHQSDIFPTDQFETPRFVVVPAPNGKGTTVVYMLIKNVPINGTLQVQARVFAQPPGSYLNIANLVIFFWGDPADSLHQNSPLSVSYFADINDKDLIQTLSLRDGRVYADDQPLPKFSQADPDFKGNKWMKFVTPPGSPSASAPPQH